MAMGAPVKLLENIEFDGWDLLNSMIVWGSQEYCAEKLNIAIDTLSLRIKEKYNMSFSQYKNKRREEAVFIPLFQKQYEIAMNGNCSMLIWLGKQYLGQKDQVETETSIKDKIEIVIK